MLLFQQAVVGIKNGMAQDVYPNKSHANQIKYSTVPLNNASTVLNMSAHLMDSVKDQSVEWIKL